MKKSVLLFILACILAVPVLEACSSYQCPAYGSVKKEKPIKSKGRKKDRFKD